MKKKQIALGSDHAGFKMKEAIKKHLQLNGYEVFDLGTNSTERANYALFGKKVAQVVAKQTVPLGIIICGTGIGISIAANRVKGVRAARVTTVQDAILAKAHNNANILALGARTTSIRKALKIVDHFLKTSFAGGRHLARIKTLDQ